MSAQQNHTVWTGYLSAGAVALGQCVCLNAAGTGYVVASATNLAASGRKAAGMAKSVADANVDPAFELQFVGLVPADVANVGTGLADEFVRVSTTGALERIASPSGSDQVVGVADADGVVRINFATDAVPATGGGGGSPGAPDKSIQYRVNSSTFGGETNWTREATGRINVTTSGFITYGAVANTFPSTGLIRTSDPGAALRPIIVGRNGNGTDLGVLSVYGYGSGTSDVLIGGDWSSDSIGANDIAMWANVTTIKANQSAFYPLGSASETERRRRTIFNCLDSSSHVALAIAISGARGYEFDITIVGTNSSDSAAWRYRVLVEGTGNTIPNAGDTTATRHVNTAGASGWTTSIATVGGFLNISVQGAAGVDFSVVAEYVMAA